MILVMLYYIVLYCIVLHPMANLFFSEFSLLNAFCTRLMTPNEVENGRGLLIRYNRPLYGTIWC